MANGNDNLGFDQLFPAGLPAAQEGAFKPLFDLPAKAESVAVASEAKKQTLIEKLGFDYDDTLGTAINYGARFASGLSRQVVGTLATLPLDAISGLAQASVPEEQVQAYNRLQTGAATDADRALLDMTAPIDDGIPQTYLERLQGTQGIQEVAQNVNDFFDISSIVDTTRTERLSRDIREATADGVSQLRDASDAFEDGNYLEAAKAGFAGLDKTVTSALSAGLSNPLAAGEYIAENVPQILAAALNPALLVGTNAGYGYDAYREGIRKFYDENEGQLPNADQRAEMGAFAASAALAETVGDATMLRAFRGAGTGNTNKAMQATAGIGGGMLREGVTEGYQTYAEARALLDDPTLEEIVEGATIGALVGGSFQGAVELARSGSPKQDSAARKATEEAFTDAVQSGDVSPLTDANSATYNPVRAVEALHQMNLTENADVEANLAQVDQIQQDVTADVSAIQARLKSTTPAEVARIGTIVEQLEAAGTDQAQIAEMREIHDAVSSYTPAQRKADETRLAQLENQLGEIHTAAERMRVDTSPEQAEVEAMATDAQTGDTQAADRLLTLTMINPDSVDTQVADALAQSEALSEPQRIAMRLFSEAQVAANALKGLTGVRSDIATGGDGFKGISQYRNALRMAIANGNEEAARSQVDGIAAFAASRASKLAAITTAYEQVKGTNNSINLVRNEQGEWGPTDLKGAALKKAGGLVVDARSFKLRDGVAAEADVLAKTAAAFDALLNAAPSPVSQPVVQPNADVQGEVTPAAPEAVAEPTVEAAPVAPVAEETAAPVAEQEAEVSAENAVDDVARIETAGGVVMPLEGVAKDGDHAMSPWLFADGKIVGTFQDHISFAQEYSGKERATYSDFMKETGAIRASFFNDASGSFVVSLHTAEGQALTPEQVGIIQKIEEIRGEPVTIIYGQADGMQNPAYKITALDELQGNQQTASAPEDAPSTAESVPTNAGQLTVIGERTGDVVTADNYRSVNLVSELFEQQPGNETDASVRPLVAVKDFVSAVKAGEVRAQDFIDQEGALTAPQTLALNAFFNFAQFSAQAIRDQFKVTAARAKRPDFFYRDMAQFLQNADGQIDENVATAVSYGMFSWANENATQLVNSPESINAILLKDLDDDVSPLAYKELSLIGTRESVVASQLGGRIVQAMGLRPNQQGSNAELSKLEASIGARAIAAMVKLGIVERVQLPDVKLQALMNSGEAGNPRTNHTFVRVKSQEVDGKREPAPIVKRIRERNTGSQSVVAKMMSVEAAGVEPSYTPVKFDQPFAKRTGQTIPKGLAETLNREGAKAHVVRQNMWHVWGRLSKQALYEMAGVVSTSDNPTHVENLDSRNAKNDGLIQQIDNADAFIKAMVADTSTNGLDQELFFGRSVWKPQRVGLTTNVLNPQTSKPHRHMVAMKSWNAKVDLADAAMMNNLKLRVLEAFGKKTEATNTPVVLAGYDAVVSNPAIQAGIDALVDVLRDTGNTNEEAIVAAVKAGGENFHSFDALVVLAELRIAEQDGKPSIETSFMGEVDGVTNGPMLSILMLGAKGFETMNRGGFFELDSPYTQFNDYHAVEGNLDLYEANIASALNRLQGRNVNMLNAMQAITGQLQTAEGNVTSKGRSIIKKPLTALMFGSNPKTAVEGMADGFVEAIYSRIEDAAANRDNAAIDALFTAVNTLLRSPKAALEPKMGFERALETKLTDQQKAALKKVFYEMMGEPTEKALADNYATFIARRNVINQTAQLSFDLFNAVRDGVTEYVVETSPEVVRNNAGEAIRTLTKEQQTKVDELMGDMAPILQTAMSQAANQREAGMYMAKSQRKLDSSLPYEQEVAFGDMVNTIAPDGQLMGIGSSKVSSTRTEDIDPGVMPFITSIHSSDSAIASAVYGQMEALNVHDALGVDLNNVAKVGQELNKATFNTLMEYSSPSAMAKMLEEVLAGTSKVMQNPALAARIQPKLHAKISKRIEKKRGSITEQLDAIRETSRQADTDKLTMMSELKAIGQYATEGGSYLVTDADRAAAAKKLGEVGNSFDPSTESIALDLDTAASITPAIYSAGSAAVLSNTSVTTLAPATSLNTLASLEQTEAVVRVIDSMVSGNRTLGDAVQILPEHQAAEVINAVNNASEAKLSVWGQLGAPVVQSDVNLVALLEGNALTAHNLIDSLVAYVQDPFQRTVLQMARKCIPANVRVNYITAQTGPEGAFGEGVDKSRGWYAQRNGTEALFIKSPEFVESGINLEMLIHELVHAALANLVDMHKGKNTAVGRAIADLEAIRVKAAEFIENNGALSAQFRNATANVHELLAWGLTNKAFQRDVLSQIQVEQRNRSFLDGLKSFIAKLTTMLFGDNKVSANNGMANLVANAAGLFQEAAVSRDTRAKRTHKYEDAIDHINAMTAEQVFDSLASLSGVQTDPRHTEYLKSLLAETVDPVYGPYGAFKEEASANRALTPLDVFLKAVNTGNLPFSSEATANAFILSQQEAFVLESVEATVAFAMEHKETIFVRQGLENLFKEARATLNKDGRNFHKGVWATASQGEKDIAKAKWDFVFRPQAGAVNKNAYLSRFAALGMASAEVRNVLAFSTANLNTPLKELPWATRLTEIFRRVMTRLASLATKVTPGMAGNQALTTLVDQLVDIEAKRKARMVEGKLGSLDQIETVLSATGEKIREKADAFGQSKFFRASRVPGVPFIGAVISTVAGDRLDAVLDRVTKTRDHYIKGRQGLMMGMVSEWRGVYDSRRLAGELFKGAKAIEQERKATIENTASAVNESFANQGQDLTQDQRNALTKVFLRTNAQAIAAVKGVSGLRDLMEDPTQMAAYRSDLEAQVTALTGNARYMISQAKDLAHHKVVGGSTSANLMLSTGNIAAMYGTKKAGQDAHLVAGLMPLLEQLVGVYGLEYSGSVDMANAKQVLRTEMNRQDGGNGVDFILKLHTGLQNKATKDLFNGTEALQQTGYVAEIHDNKIEVLLVTPADVEAHQRAGFTVGTRLQMDPNVKALQGGQRVLMTRRGSGQTGLLTGAMSFTGMNAKGSSPVTEALNMMQGTQTTSAALRQQIAAAKASAVADLFNRSSRYDPRQEQGGHMAPTLAPDGRIADYRHMMIEHNRDVLLDRDNSMDQVLGVMAGQIADKVSSANQNADVVRSMFDQYRADYTSRPASYLRVAADSNDASLAEAYRLLPESTRKEIKKVWKEDAMYVPADQIDLIFGYRKFSLTNAFAALPTDRNLMEKTLVAVTSALFGEKAALRVGQAEDIMQALVKEMKDIIVVKNVVTLAGNIMSNMTLLAWEGVPLQKAAASHAIAIKAALDFRKDSKRLMQLQQSVDIGYFTDTATAEAEMVVLRDRLARNPIKPLIDAGLMPTIVEDVEVDDNRYSYKAQLERKVDRFTSKVPAWMRTVGRQVYMTHDTATYKFLSQSTQLSDLVARYALYEHATTRRKDPLSQADALRLAEDSFVNYDLPSHRTLQYLNDMGIVMFTKYYLRIQKVIMRLVRERPARGLILAALENYISGLQSVMDSSWVNKIGNNPLQDGALGYLGSLKELPAIKLL